MICVIIPSLNPHRNLIGYIEKLIDQGIKSVIVINDGSDKSYDKIFDHIRNIDGCTVLIHQNNKGKGAALKTAYKYFSENYPEYKGVITADSDGQHDAEDILNISNIIRHNYEKKAILGQRNLYNKNVPIRSRIGNASSALLFSLLYGCNIWDTQSGLRGFSADLIPKMIKIKGERYDYEMNVLSYLRIHNIDIVKVPIKTIYINNNKGSHYRTVYDTSKIFIRILSSFMKHTIPSLVFGIIDVFIFAVCYYLLFTATNQGLKILICTITARICSIFINCIAAYKTNLSQIPNKTRTINYSIWFIQLFVSYLLILKLSVSEKFNILFIKYFTDLFINIITYQLQKRIHFNKKKLKYQ